MVGYYDILKLKKSLTMKKKSHVFQDQNDQITSRLLIVGFLKKYFQSDIMDNFSIGDVFDIEGLSLQNSIRPPEKGVTNSN